MPRTRFSWSLFLLVVAVTAPAGLRAENPLIRPPQVLQTVEAVQADVESIRFLMGAALDQQPDFTVREAAPHEVFFVALALFRNANRLAFEHVRLTAPEPSVPEGKIVPADVQNVVLAAQARITLVKENLGISQPVVLNAENPAATPSDVFSLLVQTNRQLSLMLERRFSPGDVFEEVTRSVAYAARIVEALGSTTGIPDAPPFVAGKRPSDVYRRLLGCYERIKKVADQSGVAMLELQVDPAIIDSVRPSDVYSIAALLDAELAHLHAQLPSAEPPRKVFYAGRKFPSHVYQRAGMLERQLSELERLVAGRPNAFLQPESTP